MSSNNNKVINHNYSRRSELEGGFKTMETFYPFYLGEHCNKINRRLHLLANRHNNFIQPYNLAIKNLQPKYILYSLIEVYSFAWFGHFMFEKNKPATFRYPIWSFLCDIIMWGEIVSGKRAF